MNLSNTFLEALKKVLLPIVDSAVKASPTFIDDLVWAAIRARFTEAATTAHMIQIPDAGVAGLTPDSVLASFKAWVDSLLSKVDGYVVAWRTPFELDDAIWKYIRDQITAVVNQIQFVKRADQTFGVSAAVV